MRAIWEKSNVSNVTNPVVFVGSLKGSIDIERLIKYSAASSYVLILIFQPSLSLSTKTFSVHNHHTIIPYHPSLLSFIHTQERKREKTKTKSKGGRCMSHNTTHIISYHTHHLVFPKIHIIPLLLPFPSDFSPLLSSVLLPFSGIFVNNNGLLFIFLCLFFLSVLAYVFLEGPSVFPLWCVMMRFLVMGIFS